MENSNRGDMGPLVNTESILTKEAEEKQDDVVIKDVWGKEVSRFKTPMTFIKKEDVEKAFLSKEEEEWIKQFSGISIPNEEEYNGYRHHHYKLADKISGMCERIKELELFQKMIRSRYSEEYWIKVKRYIKKVIAQEERIRQEKRKLEVLKKERATVHYGR